MGPELFLTERRISAGEPSHTVSHFLVAWVGINRRRQGARVSSKPLRQEQVAGLPINVRDRRVPQRMKRIQLIESRPGIAATSWRYWLK